MAMREIYETTFDEDVQTDSSANQCPECHGRVTTNAVETISSSVKHSLDIDMRAREWYRDSHEIALMSLVYSIIRTAQK